MIKLLVFILTLLICNDVIVRCEPKLKLLHVVFRHGEKVPHKFFQNYPNDPHGNHSYYPLPSGALTNEGKMREYKIGKMLRDRYDDFFGSIYWPDAIYARSSGWPRAKMSLQLVLAGLFPPVGIQDWNPALSWQPMDMFNEPLATDVLFFEAICPLWKKEHKKLLQDEEVQRVINQYKETMNYLTEHTGKVINTTNAVYNLFNLFREQKMQNLTLPEWTNKVYPYPMENITILEFKLRSYNTKLKRYSGGILLEKITEDMKDLVIGSLTPPGRKAFLFSGHENLIVSLALTLGTNEPEIPDYGSTIMIETLEENNEHFVRILLWTGVTEELIIQNIPGCSEICPLQKFLRLLNDVIPDDCEKTCIVPKENDKNNSGVKLSIKYINLIISFGLVQIIFARNLVSTISL